MGVPSTASIATSVSSSPAEHHVPGKPEERVQDRVLRESLTHALGGVDRERLGLAQVEQPEDVIDVAVGENDRRNGRMPSVARPQNAIVLHLAEHVRGSVQKYPVRSVGRCGDGILSPGFERRVTGSNGSQLWQPQFHRGKPHPRLRRAPEV